MKLEMHYLLECVSGMVGGTMLCYLWMFDVVKVPEFYAPLTLCTVTLGVIGLSVIKNKEFIPAMYWMPGVMFLMTCWNFRNLPVATVGLASLFSVSFTCAILMGNGLSAEFSQRLLTVELMLLSLIGLTGNAYAAAVVLFLCWLLYFYLQLVPVEAS